MTARTPARPSRSRTLPGSITSTLWACGPTPIDHTLVWPPRVLSRALLEYSAPGHRVLLLPRTAEADHLVADLDRVPAHGHVRGADTDLIVACALPGTDALPPWRLAEIAASRLRAAGLLVVLTRPHRTPDGKFHDPSADIVNQAQNTDLLYLQHLIAAPVHRTQIVPTPTGPGRDSGPGDNADHTGEIHTDPVHLDVLVFYQPHDMNTAA
ncbi:hypothetical protein ABIA39_000266 [Nocardia sp. GAS34]|uniref:hypothetical protein n=1 Tax=unclassified Nocardia TaxID=2637762 RepID=UPI003D1F9E45